jgi:hypothetical protein
MKIIIDKCPACDPINRIIEKILERGYKILESKLDDYHFHQLYFKVNAKIDILDEIDISGFTIKDSFLVCDCHWSRIEFALSVVFNAVETTD